MSKNTEDPKQVTEAEVEAAELVALRTPSGEIIEVPEADTATYLNVGFSAADR